MEMREARNTYNLLHAAWAEVHVEATAARRSCTSKFSTGAGPTADELRLAELLEAEDEALRDEMDEFIGRYFGD